MDERRFEILTTTSVSRFFAFYVIKFELKKFCEIFVANSLNYCFFKRFLLINLNKVVFLEDPDIYHDSVPHLCTQRFQLARFLRVKIFYS